MLTRVLLTLLMLAFGSSLAMAEGTEADKDAAADAKTTIVSLGLADSPVDEDTLLKREALQAPRFNSGGVAYGWVAHAKKGDKVEIHLKLDGNSLMNNVRDVADDDASVLLQAGKTGVPAGGWPSGGYTAHITVTRGGETVAEQETDPIPFE